MAKISTIIFDLGGVILDIDQERTIRAFGRMGAGLDQISLASSVFNDFETGKIQESEFISYLLKFVKEDFSSVHLEEAWNRMLLHVLPERLQLIGELRKKYRICLLSNTNSIHIRWFVKYLREQNMHESWSALFDRVFFSYEIGLRKPDPACYAYVAGEMGFAPEQCLFIDDSPVNIRGAEKAGMHTFTAHRPVDKELMNEIRNVIKRSAEQK